MLMLLCVLTLLLALLCSVTSALAQTPLKMQWDPPPPCTPVACPVETYVIERSVNGGPFVGYGEVSGTLTTFADTQPQAGTDTFQVRAKNSQGVSAPSNALAFPVPQIPGMPVNLRKIP